MKYSAVTAKVRAMHGKLLTASQWESIQSAGSLRSVWDILRRCPGWSAVGDAPPEMAAMIQALAGQFSDDCHRIGLFLESGDREEFRLFCRHQLAEAAMTPEDYQRWWASVLHRDMNIRRVVGAEVDAMNLVYILRLRRFPQTARRAKEYLIPIHYELREETVDRLLKAADDQAVLEILGQTRWGEIFKSLAPGALEKQYQHYMELLCHHLLTSSNAGVGVAQAFLILKDMERRKLIRVMSAVQSGVDPHTVV